MKKALLAVAMLSVLAGCATKHYGRQGSVTDFEKQTLSCREIDLEIAKTQGFIAQVNKESAFDHKDFLAILGDFGIGNSMERTAALESAQDRTSQLQALKAAKGNCAPST